jgi:hypothetical protein
VKYYLILLLDGKVVQINTYDSEAARDSAVKTLIAVGYSTEEYDDIQLLNEVC